MNNNIFKNSGIRGIIPTKVTLWHRIKHSFSKDTSGFLNDVQNVHFLSIAISHYLHRVYNMQCNVLIATDTRTSSKWILNTFKKNLAIHHKHQIFNMGIVPTPFVAKAVGSASTTDNNECTPFFQLGIMITASHNPPEYNGIKVFTPNGPLTEQEELDISRFFYETVTYYKNHIPTISDVIDWYWYILFYTTKSLDYLKNYINDMQQTITHKQFEPFKVILDCANGATYQIAEQIFKQYGINTVAINNTPTGNNINEQSGCSNPQLLIDAVNQHNANWGCAFDGDGDRVIIVDDKGSVFDGDDIIMVLAQHPRYKNQKTVVGTIMTNQVTQKYFEQQDKQFIRTDVGERNIIQKLLEHNALLGSEACGHITVLDHAPCSDGIFAALMFFDTIYTQNIDLHNYKKNIQIHATLSLKNTTITDDSINQIKNKYAIHINPGRIVIRKSNTEPVLRIMAEHKEINEAQQILDNIKNEFTNL